MQNRPNHPYIVTRLTSPNMGLRDVLRPPDGPEPPPVPLWDVETQSGASERVVEEDEE